MSRAKNAVYLLATATMTATVAIACLRDNLRGGDNKPVAEVENTPSIQTGDGSKVTQLTFTSIEQAAGGGLALTLIGWAVAGVRAWRNGKDRDALIRAIEWTERFPSAKPTKAYVRDTVRNPRINERVKRLTKK